VSKEAETVFWIAVESELIPIRIVEPLMREYEELLRIFSALLATAKGNR
jgi:hypothetical protein